MQPGQRNTVLEDCRSFDKLCPTLRDPVDCSTPGFPVPHHLLERARFMPIKLVMPSNHLISAALFCFCLQSFQHQGVFQ